MLKHLRRKFATLGPAVFRWLGRTWRLRTHGPLPVDRCVIAFWHGEMLPAWLRFAHQDATALVSRSRDGGLLTELLESWGFVVVRGSSSKGSEEALAEMVSAAQRGRVLITPDGPRGPVRKMKPGAVVAAHRAGVPLYLCRVQASSAIRGTNWDRFLIPLPFATIDLDYQRLDIPADAGRAQIDALIAEAEQSLNAPWAARHANAG
jgi:lysophospholipid acyltransferase (LPLAT)-like uncharacterized protein